MNKLDQLIQELCPDGVEFKKVSDVIKKYSEKAKSSNITLVYTVSKEYGIIPSLEYWAKATSEKRINTQIYSDDVSNYNVIRKNMFAYNPARLNIGSINCLFDKEDGLLSPMYTVFKIDEEKILPKYMLIFLKSEKTIFQIDSMKEVGARFRFDFANWSKILIPIPPIEVQREIVRILDKFTELTAELTEKLSDELTARKKQYEFYRDKLLTFDPHSVEFKKLGEVCSTITDYTAAGSFADIAKNVKYITRGKGYAQLIRTTDLKSNFLKPDNFVYVDQHAFNYLWRVNLNSEGLVLPNVGNCGEVYYVTPDMFPLKFNVLGPNAILVKSTTVLNRYLYHLFLSQEFQRELMKIVSPTGQTKFNKTNFKEIKIPIPPMEVQREIVRILDKFSELTTDLTSGLPAEIAARKKQYEYYRDKLLTFAIKEA